MPFIASSSSCETQISLLDALSVPRYAVWASPALGALGVGAPAALRAALGADVGSLLHDRVHLELEARTREDARVRLAPLACRERRRAPLTGGAACLA